MYTFPKHVGKNLARNNPTVVTTLDCQHMRSRFKGKKRQTSGHTSEEFSTLG